MVRCHILLVPVVAALASGTLIASAPGSVASGAPTAAHSAAAPRQPRLARPIPGLLDGVAAISAANVWVVGDDGASDTQILHWNGHAWQRVAAPNPHPRGHPPANSLTSISAVSPRDIWAVGHTGPNALIVRWNGKAWRQVASPALTHGAAMTGVVALSATNAWAVGGTGSKALTEHWNGHAWRQVPVPSPASAELLSVSASAADNVWAVGDYFYGPSGIHSGVLIVHWNGKAWRRVAAASPPDSDLFGVSVLSAANAWAVGGFTNGTVNTFTLIERWNGKAWTQTRVAGPVPYPDAQLWAVAVRSPSLAFAVGDTTPFLAIGSVYVLRWNGHAWREVTSPPQPPGFGFGVGFNSARSAWLVGVNETSPLDSSALIEHWNGSAWR